MRRAANDEGLAGGKGASVFDVRTFAAAVCLRHVFAVFVVRLGAACARRAGVAVRGEKERFGFRVAARVQRPRLVADGADCAGFVLCLLQPAADVLRRIQPLGADD